MSEVAVTEDQFELVSIVEIVQTKLAKNFTLLLKRINNNESLLNQHEQRLAHFQSQTESCFKKVEESIQIDSQKTNARIQELLAKIQLMEDRQRQLNHEAGEQITDVKKLSDELSTTRLQFDDKLKQKQLQLEEATRTIGILLNEQSRLSQQISYKESKLQSQKLNKQITNLKDKNVYIENELKLAHHKIQKMEILNQKAQRLQIKKEVQIIKQIQQKIRNQIRNNETATIGEEIRSKSSSINPIYQQEIANKGKDSINQDENSSGFQQKQNVQPSEKPVFGRISSIMTDSLNILRLDPSSNGMEAILQKWGNKIRYLQAKLKEVIQNLKILNRHEGSKKQTQTKDSSAEIIKDKINQIKPEIVKLWAKLDTAQDRISFNERKLQEKTKCINQLTNMIKDNNISRLEEKLKNIQTQNFTSFKQIKAKLQTKVNQTDYDKHCRQIDQRIVQINEMIYLKSDKLEVKKALLFLQSKIKEIILVISQDQENEKDALLTKKQLKCISCDKELDKFSGVASTIKGNWDGLPFKDHPPEMLGRFGMTNFGSLSKKLKKLEGKDLPVLTKRGSLNQSMHGSPGASNQ